MALVPLKRCNQFGFGMLESIGVTTNGTVTTIKFNDHPQRRINFFGGFFVKITQDTSAIASTNTVVFQTGDDTSTAIPVKLFDGDDATMAYFSTIGGGVALMFYDVVNNRLQLISYVA